jgi:uncharacterized protein YkwD
MKYHFLVTLALLAAITTTAQANEKIDSPDPLVSPPSQSPIANPARFNHVMDGIELAVYNRVNLYRMSLDLPPLIIDPAISAQAKAHSEEMAKTGTMNHDGFENRIKSISQTVTYRSAAENVATNLGNTQPDIVALQGWIDSPGHYRNLVGRYDLTGIGVAQDAKGEYYFTQIFIRKQK